MTHPRPVLVVSGLQAEARIAEGEGVFAVAGGGNAERLTRLLEATGPEPQAVISFGIAGGLAAALTPGTVVIASDIADHEMRWPTDPHWSQRLRSALPQARYGSLAGVDNPVASTAEKARLNARSGALAVDMESHVAARFASRRGLPFAALRIVSDPAERTLPAAALVGMRPDGTTNIPAVLRSLAARPDQLVGLIRTALDANKAFKALRQSRSRLGAQFGWN